MPEISFFPTSSNVRSSPPLGRANGPAVTFSPDFWHDDSIIKIELEELKTEDGIPNNQPSAPPLGR